MQSIRSNLGFLCIVSLFTVIIIFPGFNDNENEIESESENEKNENVNKIVTSPTIIAERIARENKNSFYNFLGELDNTKIVFSARIRTVEFWLENKDKQDNILS